MKNFWLILLFFILLNCAFGLRKLNRLTNRELMKMEKNKECVGLIYINQNNMSHNFFMEELADYLEINPLEKFNFGYLDVENDKKLLEYFKIRNVRDSGLILYNFANKNYYVEEGLNHLKEVKEIFEKVEKGNLNWSSNSIIEKIFFLITGKRYGKEAHSMFSFGICFISIIIYTYVNMRARREERKMIEKRFKTQ
jgi:hypothetical protein